MKQLRGGGTSEIHASGDADAADEWLMPSTDDLDSDTFFLDEDEELFEDDEDEEVHQLPARELATSPLYKPLQCNEAILANDTCLASAVPFSNLVADQLGANPINGPVVVPCGQCVAVDITDGSTLTLPKGLDIIGRLHFPPTANVVINTTAVFVQGQLDMTEPTTTPGADDIFTSSHNDPQAAVTITLFGVEDQYFFPYTGCNGEYLDTCTEKKNLGTKPIVVAGGKLNIQARNSTCPSWTHLVEKVSDTELRLDSAFASCVNVGDSLAVTSDETWWAKEMVRTITAVDESTGIVNIEPSLTSALPGLNGPGEPEFAVEVASLSRSVVFEAQTDNPSGQIGGHLIVYHTPNVPQLLSGVRFVNFGQGGILGRYPIHWHKSDDSPSTISGNVVAQSNQRCIIIHNTNRVTVKDNVAHDTRGHCFATETGIEEDNVFARNLGIMTRLLSFSNGQSDSASGKAATFWIRNMNNEIYGNVAAGSESSGWWFEMKDKGSSMRSTEPVSSFRDNVAHSCNIEGMTTYKRGWNPSTPAVFDNIRIYKNNGESGWKSHITGYLTIKNSLFADNKLSIRYGVWNTGVTIKDSKIIGLSLDWKLRKGESCPVTLHGVYASYNNYPTSSIEKSITLENVTMERFVCSSRAITPYFDSRQNENGMGNPIRASVTFNECEDSESYKPHFGCDSNAKYAFMEDFGGGLGPSSMGSDPGFLIRNDAHMKAFLPPDACEPLPYGGAFSSGTKCNAFCKNVCLRYFNINNAAGATKLRLTQGETSYTYYLDSGSSTYRVVLPSGNYFGQFYDDNDNEVIGAFKPDVTAYRAPKCSDYADELSFTFTTHEPTESPSAAPTVTSQPSPELLYVSSGYNKKCPEGNTRLFRTPGPMTLRDCYQLCYESSGCHYFSYGDNPTDSEHEDMCMGCTSNAVLTGMTGFEGFEMVVKQDFGYEFFADNKKCPFGSRLFTTSGGLSISACYNKCEETDGCERFTWGTTDVTNSDWLGMCMGCTANAGLHSHTGFMAFDMSQP